MNTSCRIDKGLVGLESGLLEPLDILSSFQKFLLPCLQLSFFVKQEPNLLNMMTK